jgi:hypothetical protein
VFQQNFTADYSLSAQQALASLQDSPSQHAGSDEQQASSVPQVSPLLQQSFVPQQSQSQVPQAHTPVSQQHVPSEQQTVQSQCAVEVVPLKLEAPAIAPTKPTKATNAIKG